MNKIIYQYRAILFAIAFMAALFTVLYQISQPSEVSLCFDIYKDETVDRDIREHCKMIVEEWRMERALEEFKAKQDYIKMFEEELRAERASEDLKDKQDYIENFQK